MKSRSVPALIAMLIAAAVLWFITVIIPTAICRGIGHLSRPPDGRNLIMILSEIHILMMKTRMKKMKIPNGNLLFPDRSRKFTMKTIKTLYSLESKLNK